MTQLFSIGIVSQAGKRTVSQVPFLKNETAPSEGGNRYAKLVTDCVTMADSTQELPSVKNGYGLDRVTSLTT